MTTPLAAIPVKAFGVAKARLAPVLDAATRARLGKAVAARTASAAAACGAEVVVVTADRSVAAWARRRGWGVVAEGSRGATGLDRAAFAAAAYAGGAPWAVIHADLPLVTADDLGIVFAALGTDTVLSPARDGGTNVLGSTRDLFPFRYGPGSFRRHLAAAVRLGGTSVIVRPRLALDLDGPADLTDAIAAPGGEWLRRVLPDPTPAGPRVTA